MKIVLLIVFGLIIGGCASIQRVPIPQGDINKNTARIQVDREIGFAGGVRAPVLTDNGVMVGDLINGGKLIWDRPAGDSCLSAWQHKLCFNALGGRITHVVFSIHDGLMLDDFSATDTKLNIVHIQ